ncbi:MAG: DNA-formamidopyrimidine glycosylase, partial [Actinobacteria bacterium]
MELPEVEVMRRDLEKEVVGRRIKDADVRPQRNAMRVIRRHARRKEFSDGLAGKKITKVDRKGKYLLLHLDDGDVLVV